MQSQTNNTDVSHHASAIEIRTPRLKDAADVWRLVRDLVRDCEVLDTNSCYAYLLACRDFATTSLVAKSAGKLVGFVVAYIPPDRRDGIFVWQVDSASGLMSTVGSLLVHVPPAVQYPLFDAALERYLGWHADPDELVQLLQDAGVQVEKGE